MPPPPPTALAAELGEAVPVEAAAGMAASSAAVDPGPPPEPPDAFVCSITQELMEDPVMALDGHTYERCAIERWLERRHTSPKTGEELTGTMLLPNHSMRSQILDWREQHNVASRKSEQQSTRGAHTSEMRPCP